MGNKKKYMTILALSMGLKSVANVPIEVGLAIGKAIAKEKNYRNDTAPILGVAVIGRMKLGGSK